MSAGVTLKNAGRSRGFDDQHGLRALAEEGQAARQREHVVKRQRNDHRLLTVLRLGDIQAATCSTLATMLPWVKHRALGHAGVPPVYCRKARSSWVSVTSSSDLRAAGGQRAVEVLRTGRPPCGTIFFTCLTTALVSRRLTVGSKSPTCVVSTVRAASP